MGKISKNRKIFSVFSVKLILNLITLISTCFILDKNYLKPTAACQTKANSKNITGIAGMISTIGRKAV
jgi:energy-converting hydrogenase Eha subunit F